MHSQKTPDLLPLPLFLAFFSFDQVHQLGVGSGSSGFLVTLPWQTASDKKGGGLWLGPSVTNWSGCSPRAA